MAGGMSTAQLHEARIELAACDAGLARVHAAIEPLVWRRKTPGFAGLARLIIEQQVSVASARAIVARVEAGLGEITPEHLLAHDVESLRGLGLSIQKANYLHNAAHAQADPVLVLTHIAGLDDAGAVTALTQIKGIGRWTAEAYLMGCEGRTDLLPAGDLALQEAIRHADESDERPTTGQLYDRAEAWRPWRGVAAHMLWAYYGQVKNQAQ